MASSLSRTSSEDSVQTFGTSPEPITSSLVDMVRRPISLPGAPNGLSPTLLHRPMDLQGEQSNQLPTPPQSPPQVQAPSVSQETQTVPVPVKSTKASRSRPVKIPQRNLRRDFIRPGLLRETVEQYISTNKYKYTAITHLQIRILRIFAGKEEDTIRCRLIPITLGEQEYEALSYCWGDDPPTHEIKITRDEALNDLGRPDSEEQTFYIRNNLFDAMKTLRETNVDVDLWIDALCINQEDVEEKKTQIAKMEDIYSTATHVIIWLGIPEDLVSSQAAFKFIEDLCDLRLFDDRLSKTYAYQWEALAELMTNNWFSRRWVIQELALASRASVQCGNLSVAWDDFADVVAMFVLKFDLIKRFLSIKKLKPEDSDPLREAKRLGPSVLVDATNNLFRRRNDNQIVERQKTLETLVSTLTAYEAGDPRDIIYGVLSLARDTHRGSRTTPLSPSGQPTRLNGVTSPLMDGVDTNQKDTASTSKEGDVLSELPKLQRAGTVWSNSDLGSFHGISADYDKDLLEVCKEFVKASVKSSNSLDIICRHWAPVTSQMNLTLRESDNNLTKEQKNWVTHRKLASWMGSVSDGPFGTPKDALNGRKNGDSLVGLPGRSYYNASDGLPPRDKDFPQIEESEEVRSLREAAKQAIRQPLASLAQVASAAHARSHSQSNAVQTVRPLSKPEKVTDGTISVKGLQIDVLQQHGPTIVDGVISEDALIMGGWIPCDSPNHPELPAALSAGFETPADDWIPDELCRTLVADRSPDGDNAPRWYLRACRHAVANRSLTNTINTVALIEGDRESVMIEFLKRARDVTWNRRLFRSKQSHPGDEEGRGRLGLAPKTAMPGDIICILFGCSVPVLLRSRKEGGYTLVGECYLHGVMDGEAVSQHSKRRLSELEETFVLH